MDSKNPEMNFPRPLKINRTRWTFIWALNVILKNAHFPNKIAIKLRNKILFDFIIKSPIFLYFGTFILFPLSYFIKEIFEEKIIKIKRSSFQNLRKLKYENNEIPNSLWGSLSCVKFLGSTKTQINMICNDDLLYNIPNWNFGMLHPS